MKVLLTGFAPFGGETLNPSWEAVKAVKAPAGMELHKLEVPVSFRASGELVCRIMDTLSPDAVLCVGQAGGRWEVTPERVALNVDDASLPDNDGDRPTDRPIDPFGPVAYFSDLPVKSMAQHIRKAGVPAALSNSAGTYVCNHLMYTVLHHGALHTPRIRGGFIHVPYIPEQVQGKGVPSLPLSQLMTALEAALSALMETPCNAQEDGSWGRIC